MPREGAAAGSPGERPRTVFRTDNDGMSKQAFLEQVELERSLLAEGVPIASLAASNETFTFGPGGVSTHLHVSFFDVSGGHAANLLRLRLTALFFGAAWKVLDMAIELSLKRAGKKVKYQAKAKADALQSCRTQMPELPAEIWAPLTMLYVNTTEIRHALVHRRAQIVDGALIGSHGESGKVVFPISHKQQLRFCELVQRMSDAIERGFMTPREQRQCRFLLWELRDLHGDSTIQPAHRSSIVRVAFELPQSRQIPVALIKAQLNNLSPGWTGIDLQLTDSSSGARFFGELEHVTEDYVEVDPHQLPDWLKAQVLPCAEASVPPGGEEAG